jgi:hypothetical protein
LVVGLGLAYDGRIGIHSAAYLWEGTLKRLIAGTALALVLVWCAVDMAGAVYACFGFDYTACEEFTDRYTGPIGPLHCEIR